MPNGDSISRARGERLREEYASLDRQRALAIERVKVRADLKSVGDDEPDTGRIEVEAIRRTQGSEPPPDRISPLVIVLTVAKKFPAWGAVIVALAAIGAYVFLQSR